MVSFFTIGHSNHAMDRWLGLLRQHKVEVVVDTRSSPYSKYVPQFDRGVDAAFAGGGGNPLSLSGRRLGGRRQTRPTTTPMDM